jgi:hypothetical protein
VISHKTSDSRARKLPLALRLILPLVAGAVALATLGAAAPVPAVQQLPVADGARESFTDLGHPVDLPTLAIPVEAPAAEPVAQPAVEAPAAPAPASWNIGISAFGWQNELDACQWVLMDMVASVPLPIVAAHNYCGGDIVLEMQVGDTVTLGGYGFDGTYVVTGDRDAWSGGDAAEAIAGMGGDVILQTCYWANDGTERLVSLQRIG